MRTQIQHLWVRHSETILTQNFSISNSEGKGERKSPPQAAAGGGHGSARAVAGAGPAQGGFSDDGKDMAAPPTSLPGLPLSGLPGRADRASSVPPATSEEGRSGGTATAGSGGVALTETTSPQLEE
jgi:hypothetical protein